MAEPLPATGRSEPRPGLQSGPSMTRRRLLAGVGQTAVLALLPAGCVPLANAAWADNTFWDDGTGWSA